VWPFYQLDLIAECPLMGTKREVGMGPSIRDMPEDGTWGPRQSPLAEPEVLKVLTNLRGCYRNSRAANFGPHPRHLHAPDRLQDLQGAGVSAFYNRGCKNQFDCDLGCFCILAQLF